MSYEEIIVDNIKKDMATVLNDWILKKISETESDFKKYGLPFDKKNIVHHIISMPLNNGLLVSMSHHELHYQGKCFATLVIHLRNMEEHKHEKDGSDN